MALNGESAIKLLRNIYIYQLKKRISQKTLAELLHMNVRDPRFREILTILRNENIIVEHETFSQVKLIEIRFGKLEDYIRTESKDFAEWGKFIEISKPYSFSY
jgi:hypothetical protein